MPDGWQPCRLPARTSLPLRMSDDALVDVEAGRRKCRRGHQQVGITAQVFRYDHLTVEQGQRAHPAACCIVLVQLGTYQTIREVGDLRLIKRELNDRAVDRASEQASSQVAARAIGGAFIRRERRELVTVLDDVAIDIVCLVVVVPARQAVAAERKVLFGIGPGPLLGSPGSHPKPEPVGFGTGMVSPLTHFQPPPGSALPGFCNPPIQSSVRFPGAG